MAVPKKKKSKSKRNQRHAVWKGKAALAAQKAISLGKSVLTGKAQGFVYPIEEEEGEEELLRSQLKCLKYNGIDCTYSKFVKYRP